MNFCRNNKGFSALTVGLVAAGVFLAASPTARRTLILAMRKSGSLMSDFYTSLFHKGQRNDYNDINDMDSLKKDLDHYIKLPTEE